jgi:Fic family protein
MKILNYQFSVTPQIKGLFKQIKEQEKKLKTLSIPAKMLQKIFKHNYLQQAYSSTKIEYSLIHYNTAQKVLYRKSARNEEEREVLNAANAHLAVQSHLEKSLSDDWIIDTHRQISEGLKGSLTEPDYRPGKYRKVQNYLGDPFSDRISYTFPDPKEVPVLMQGLNHFMNSEKTVDPLVLPGIFHFVFIAIHPFVNGNGRTARVLEDFLLKKAGYNLQNLYNLSQYYYANLQQYHFFLNRGREQLDLTDFATFYLQGIAESQRNVFAEKVLLERLEKLHALPTWKTMDALDKKWLNYLAKNEEISIRKALKLTSKKLSPETLRLRFQKYIQSGIMKKVGSYKTIKYIWNPKS